MDIKSLKRLEEELWDAADNLRANSKLTSNQYCMPVLGLIFLRYAYSRFVMVEQQLRKEYPSRPGREFILKPEHFKSKSALYLDKHAQYQNILALPENVASAGWLDTKGDVINSLGEVLNNAMSLIEEQSEQLEGILPKEYHEFDDELLRQLLKNFDNNALDEVGGDILGRIYEYFLGKFAKTVAQDDGVFFTPKSLVRMIVNIIEPESGILLDPACGSGGMFVQTGDFVNHKGFVANEKMTFYGQEKTEFNAKLCRLNIAVHGLNGKIAAGDGANTFYNDCHNLEGKCDYVMANPPFNVDKVKYKECLDAGRLPFGMPTFNEKTNSVSNGNYLWISYFYAFLNEHGRSGFVMASSASDGKEKELRKKLVETGHVDVMISVANNFFYTLSLPCSLWFFNKGKSENLLDKVLFIDARSYYTVVDRNLNEWNPWQEKNLAAIVWLYRGERDKYKELLGDYRVALLDKVMTIESQGFGQLVSDTSDLPKLLEKVNGFIKELQKTQKEEIDKAKRNEKKKLRQYYENELANIQEVVTLITEWDWLQSKFGTEGEYQDVAGLCKIATREEIAAKDYSLTPGAYVGVAPVEDDGVDFTARMKEIHQELLALQKESDELMATISKNLEEMGL